MIQIFFYFVRQGLSEFDFCLTLFAVCFIIIVAVWPDKIMLIIKVRWLPVLVPVICLNHKKTNQTNKIFVNFFTKYQHVLSFFIYTYIA